MFRTSYFWYFAVKGLAFLVLSAFVKPHEAAPMLYSGLGAMFVAAPLMGALSAARRR